MLLNKKGAHARGHISLAMKSPQTTAKILSTAGWTPAKRSPECPPRRGQRRLKVGMVAAELVPHSWTSFIHFPCCAKVVVSPLIVLPGNIVSLLRRMSVQDFVLSSLSKA